MNENIKKWIKALRSGKHKKGVRYLHDYGDKFCCLGVACKVAEKDGVEVNYGVGDRFLKGHNLDSQIAVKKWLGLKDSRGGGIEFEGVMSLTALNDGLFKNDKNFKRIAKVIEDNIESLTV